MALRVAVVSAACEFPEGDSPESLWSTVLHARRCFRRIPSVRLPTSDYAGDGPDSIYPIEAALLKDYRFDRDAFQIPQSLFERTDLAHWLALDVATRAWTVLGNPGADVRDRTAVIVANTLTGEFSRANMLRYRWPYVERVLRTASEGQAMDLEPYLLAAEQAFKGPFPAPDEDSLAGALANTISGRIANHHGLRGGAHTVDGACASSLVAIVTAYEKLALGDIECAIVGAVDLSLDPFELVGFARNGALAREEMRIFDAQSQGFWPGEGCGFVVLASEESVARHGWPVLGWIPGAAMSTDGHGSMTLPTAAGQALAGKRAWARAGLDPVTADYFEAHGTGTAAGDPIELMGLSDLLGAEPRAPIPVGSIKANIGHTKAAAGIAGLMKALKICESRVIPQTTACQQPHDLLSGSLGRRLAVRQAAQRIAHPRPVTVGINSFGFGGVNCHVVLQGPEVDGVRADPVLPACEGTMSCAELFLLQAPSRDELAAQLQRLAHRASKLSRAELGDLAFSLCVEDEATWRACVVACTPAEVQQGAVACAASLKDRRDDARVKFTADFSWSGPSQADPRIALVFPGQGTALDTSPLPWAARFPMLRESATIAQRWLARDLTDTSVVQPLLSEMAIASVALLRALGISPSVVVGHSFGELSALHASGCLTADQFRTLALARGECMQGFAPEGAMLAIRASRDQAYALAKDHGVDVACENSSERFVLAGSPHAIDALRAACRRVGTEAQLIASTRAFHSRLMGDAQREFAKLLAVQDWGRPGTQVVSTVTGSIVAEGHNLGRMLADQIVQPVRFSDALASLGNPDLVVLAGASSALGTVLDEVFAGRVVSMDMFGDSFAPLMHVAGALWVAGARIDRSPLFEGRFFRPCSIGDEPQFLASPCGLHAAAVSSPLPVRQPAAPPVRAAVSACDDDEATALRHVLSELTGLQYTRITGSLKLLGDLHLNSIKARHAIAMAARRLGRVQLSFDLAMLSGATVDDVIGWLSTSGTGNHVEDKAVPPSIAPWLRVISHEWTDVAAPLPAEGLSAAHTTIHEALRPLSTECRALLASSSEEGSGLHVLVLPGEATRDVAHALLTASQAFLASNAQGLLVLQGAQVANGFLRSLAAEHPQRRLCAVQYENLDTSAVETALALQGRRRNGYGELRQRGPRWQERQVGLAASHDERGGWKPKPHHTVIVTGGGKGIGAACALAVAQRFRCRMAIVGRSPVTEPEVAKTMAELRLTCPGSVYVRADLESLTQTRAASAYIKDQLGPVKAIFHAAGINRPALVTDLTVDELDATIQCKVQALDNLLACVHAGELDLLVGFASIIGEFGLAGEAHYALANEWLNQRLSDVAQIAPDCLVIPLSWSAWRSAGMAHRLEGVIERLEQSGLRPLETGEATDALIALLERPPTGAVIPCGRYRLPVDPVADLSVFHRYRFLERVLVCYPGIELIADATVSSDTDRYLRDHAPFDVPIMPLVMAMEAMASAAQAVTGRTKLPSIRDLKVNQALSCTLGQRFVMRTAVLVQDDGTLIAEIRADISGYEVVHFSALLAWNHADFETVPHSKDTLCLPAAELLYAGLCFHGQRFQRIASFTKAGAVRCEATTQPRCATDWFGTLLPQDLVTGDPGTRDGALHALQVCIPQDLVLPVAVASVQLGRLRSDLAYAVDARQVSGDGQRYVFDVDIRHPDGHVVELWRGVELAKAPATTSVAERLPLATGLVVPFLERVCLDLLATEVRAGMCLGPRRASTTEKALAAAFGSAREMCRAPDGSIRVAGLHVTSSHSDDFTVALSRKDAPLAIDIQLVPGYDADEWRLLLGEGRMSFAQEIHARGLASLSLACCLAWTLSECLSKLGLPGWPIAAAKCRAVATRHAGTLLVFEAAGTRFVGGALAMRGTSPLLAFAIAAQMDGADGEQTEDLADDIVSLQLPMSATVG